MNIGIFTDTYYPQVSGVATSIKVLREQLERQGHNVYLFTTTDPKVKKEVYERNIFRFTSIPFISFTDRRVAIRGLLQAYRISSKLQLDIIHTQTEFSIGLMGKLVAKMLKIPCVHTYHTMYEDYLHYVAKGKVLRPKHVRLMTRSFCQNLSGVIAPSDRVLAKLQEYQVTTPVEVIPTGIDVSKFQQPEYLNYRAKYGLTATTPVILTLSRVAYEKDIDRLITAMVEVKKRVTGAKLMICGDGPARADLEAQAKLLGLKQDVIFTGEIDNDSVAHYYHLANVFVSASVSESQGLTYLEALAAGIPVVAANNPYTNGLLNYPSLGATFETPAQLVSEIVTYLNNPPRIADQAARSEKLAEISAQTFGQKVSEFYKESQAYYLNERQMAKRSSEIG